MLRMAQLPNSFLGELVRTAHGLLNRSPSISLNFDIPKRGNVNEKYLDTKPMLTS